MTASHVAYLPWSILPPQVVLAKAYDIAAWNSEGGYNLLEGYYLVRACMCVCVHVCVRVRVRLCVRVFAFPHASLSPTNGVCVLVR